MPRTNLTEEEIKKYHDWEPRNYSGDDFSPIISYIPSQLYVCENDRLSYSFNVSDKDVNQLSVEIFPEDIFDIHPKSFIGGFFWVNLYSPYLSKDQVGLYQETIYASDGDQIDSKGINIHVIEINNIPEMEEIKLMTISLDETDNFFYRVNVEDREDGNQDSGKLKFDLTFFNSEPFFDIDDKGVIDATLDESSIGVHDLAICVTDLGIKNIHPNINFCGQDGKSITVCKNFSLTITDKNRRPRVIVNYPYDLSFEAKRERNLRFSINKEDLDGSIPDTYWYVDNILRQYDSNNVTDKFSHIFSCYAPENHLVRVEITDGLLIGSKEWDITLKRCAPIYEYFILTILFGSLFIILILAIIRVLKLKKVLKEKIKSKKENDSGLKKER